MTRDDREIGSGVTSAADPPRALSPVETLRAVLAGKVGRERFDLWLGRGVGLHVAGRTVRVAVGEAFRLEYLRRAFRGDLLAAAREALGCEGGEPTIEFVLDASLAARAPPIEPASRTSQQPGPVPSAAMLPTEQSDQAADAPRAPTPARRSFASLDDFIVGQGNTVAFATARGVVGRPGQYSPLTLVGPPGCGKTHLLEGIWRLARTGSQLRRVIYLTAEQFTNQFLEALKHSGTPNFRRKYRDVELLLIDDVQFFAGKQSTIIEIVHTIDTLLREGRQLVFAAARPPAELRGLGTELIARLSGGVVCPLESADAPTRLRILQQLAKRQSLPIPPDVLSTIAGQLDGDARQLAGAVHRLVATAEALGQPIDQGLAATALGDLIHASRRPVRLPDILEAVCDVFGVEASALQSTSKSPSVTLPRMLVMFLARKYTRAALSEIGRTVGRKSHSTVVSAQHKVSQWLTAGKRVPLGHGDCPLEDAVRRVESQLKLG